MPSTLQVALPPPGMPATNACPWPAVNAALRGEIVTATGSVIVSVAVALAAGSWFAVAVIVTVAGDAGREVGPA